ncbi:cyanophycinase [Propionivibrio limicola]|uniref:cyanophycinase n=1 Tax=Propionivibrio limicola TaxID=167645 RepID=UPI00129122B9|nr:cyanophycinase [Propionivibrio limicola]
MLYFDKREPGAVVKRIYLFTSVKLYKKVGHAPFVERCFLGSKNEEMKMKLFAQWLFSARKQPHSGIKDLMTATTVVVVALATGIGPVKAANKSQLSIYQHGKPVDYLPCGGVPLRTRTAVLMGGGIDVKDAYSWMIAKMTQCGDGSMGRLGNFVVIRAGGNPSYDSYINKLGAVASVVTLVVPTIETANDPAIEPYIRNAGAIWLTGGDQGDYYNFWKGSLLERLVSEQVKNRSVPIGGTSAGMMILSEFVYTADPCTITSLDALADPYSRCVALRRDFWRDRTPFPPLVSTVTDSHFDTRDRMGRLVTFLARVINDKWTNTPNARAIGVDQETALLMEYDDKTVSSAAAPKYSYKSIVNPGVSGAAYVLSVGSGSQLVVSPGQPLTFTNVKVQKIPAVGNETGYQVNVINGELTSTVGTIY